VTPIDELTILRAWEPPADGISEDERARARARLDAHIAARRAPRARARAPFRLRRPWLVAAPLLAAVAIAVVVALTSGVQEGRLSAPPATAAEALERAARAAEARPEAFPRPRQFFYVKSQSTYLACRMPAAEDDDRGFCGLTTQTREAWTSLLRDGRETTQVSKTSWPSERERQKWIAAGRPPLDQGRDGTMGLHHNGHYFLGNEKLSYRQMRDFDLSGDALYRRLTDRYIKGQGGSLHAEVFTWIGDALREQPAPPRLRAALYRALKHVPGLTYDRATTDRLGRPAVAVSRVDATRGVRSELLFDPDTSMLLAERDTVVAHVPHQGFAAPLGTVIGDAVYVKRGVVDQAGTRP
jgi:hypothetical protein